MKKPHKHAELIKAWADGAEIQVNCRTRGWNDLDENPIFWYEDEEYRIKPELKPDVIEDVFIWKSPLDCYPMMVRHHIPNLRLIFDGESGLFKYAKEIL